MTIILRKIKNAPLTIDELDGNFQDLDERIKQLNTAMATSASIATIERNGNSLWFISKTGDIVADVPLPDTTLTPGQIDKLPIFDHKTLTPGEIGQLGVFLDKAGQAYVIFCDGTKWCQISDNKSIE